MPLSLLIASYFVSKTAQSGVLKLPKINWGVFLCITFMLYQV
jgi:hypothetical protein